MPLSELDLPSLPELTSKQREVLALVADNRTSKEIAARLGISESAVNQRIESVRSRLGGIPRGQLARLYRQLSAAPPVADEAETVNLPTWQKIHLPPYAQNREEQGVEGIPPASPDRFMPDRNTGRDGSQLSAYTLDQEPVRLPREGRQVAFARVVLVLASVIAGMVIAAGITALVGPAFAHN